MIHTQYYALARALTQSFDKALITPVTQWDFNYSSVTFDQLKKYKNRQERLPVGTIDINNIEKEPMNKIINYTIGRSVIDLLSSTNCFPLAEIKNKAIFYALMSNYTINLNVTLTFETAAQMLDNLHAISEYFPTNFMYYDFRYSYYVALPGEIIDMIDPYIDKVENIFAKRKKDDASSFEFFTMMENEPIFKVNSINPTQDKNSDTHQLEISLTIIDKMIYSILNVSPDNELCAKTINIKVVIDSGETVAEADLKMPEIVIEEHSVPEYYPEVTTNNETSVNENGVDERTSSFERSNNEC